MAGVCANFHAAADAPHMTAPPRQRDRFAEDVELFVIDDEAVAFCAGTGELFALNMTATFIWLQVGDGSAPDEIARSLAQTFKVTLETARRHVREAVADCRAHGLIAGAGRPAAVSGDPFPPALPSISVDEPVPLLSPVHERSYAVLGSTFRVRYASDDQYAWVAPVFAHLAVAEAGVNVVDLLPLANGHVLRLDGRSVCRATAADRLAPLVHYVLMVTALRQLRGALLLHAGAMRTRFGDVLFCGAGGSGKTTLVAGLAVRGMGYLADDSVVLDRSHMGIHGLPFAMSVKTGGVAPLRAVYPMLDTLAEHRRPDGRSVRYLPPPEATARDSSTPSAPPRLVLFPKYVPGAECEPQPLSSVEALRRLTPLLARPAALSRADVDAMVHWIRQTPCYAVSFGAPNAAVGAINRLLVEGSERKSPNWDSVFCCGMRPARRRSRSIVSPRSCA